MAVRFASEEKAIIHSANPLKLEDLALLPTYLGKRISKARIGRIPSEINESVIVVIIMANRKDI